MPSSSNIYSEKVFAEHPIALWSLDEQVDFISYFSSAEKSLTSWTKSGTASATSTLSTYTSFDTGIYPPTNNNSVKLVKTFTTSETSAVTFTSSSKSITGSTVSFYIYSNSSDVQSVTVQVGSETAQTEYISTKQNAWLLISKTFSDASATSAVTITINFNRTIASASTASVYIDNINYGYRTEEFNGVSTGVIPTNKSLDTVAWTGTPNASTSTSTSNTGLVRTNYFTNPSFEIDTSSWSIVYNPGGLTYTIASSTDRSIVGAKSMKLSITSGTGITQLNLGYTFTVGSNGIIPGQTYTFSYWVYVTRSQGISLALGVTNPSGTTYPGISTTIPANTWTKMNFTWTMPSDLTGLNIQPNFLPSSGDIFYFDSFLAEKGNVINSYFDGSFTPYTYYSIPAYAYGTSINQGYYVCSTNQLFAKNTSMPMVYGASNTTMIYQNTNGTDASPLPSLILPGMGFMSNSGSNKEYTFESWFRINSKTTAFRRIFGPIASTDGLYIKGSFLYLKVGNAMKAHYIGEWLRPMLINITLSKNGASLFVNGEKILTINTDLVSAFSTNITEDWLAFYAYSDIPSYEVDAVAIYPYAVSEILAKRRFAYGQATEYPTSLDAYYGGTSVATDYSMANYANNYNYPDIANWSTGTSENFNIKQNYISVPEYSLPDVKINSTTLTASTLWADNYTLNNSAINLIPNTNWNTASAYLYYQSLSILSDQVSSFQAAFASPGTAPSSNQTLFTIQNKINGDYIKAYINGTTIKYDTSFSGNVTTVKTQTGITAGSQFAIGLNINVLKASSASYRQFFAVPSQLQLSIGGENAGNTFTGKIYNFGFSTNRNLSKISSYFDANGFMTYTNATNLIAFISSYTLFLNILQGYAELDIAVNSYWQDYVPLTALGKYIFDSSGNQIFGLDTIQFNIDYPELPIYSGNNYDTSSAILKTYATFQYVQDGSNKDILDSSFTTLVSPSKYGTVDPNTTWAVSKYEIINGSVISIPTSNFSSGKTNIDLSLVLHLEANIPGINNSPLKIKYLQLASRSLNYGIGAVTNPIGTKFGKEIYAYKTVNAIRDYQAKNQIKIGKTQNPYLYLTSQSGIQLAGTYDSTIDRGISVSINDRKASSYSISSLQLSMLYTQDAFPSIPNKIFEISGTSKNRFYITQANSSDRGRIFGTQVSATVTNANGSGTVVTYTTSTDHGLNAGDVVSITGILPSAYQLYGVTIVSVPTSTTFTVSNTATGTYTSSGNVEKHVSTEITFMLNGNSVREPYINIREWNTLSISYTAFLSLNNSNGEFVLTGPILLNNLSYYTIDSTLSSQQLVQRTWGTIISSGILWSAAKTYSITGASPSWQTLGLSSISVSYALDPSYIYKIFLGNNKIISNADKASGMVKFKSFEYKTYLGSQSTYSYFTPA